MVNVRIETGIYSSVVLVVMGYVPATSGWDLAMTAILASIGPPSFIVGLPLMRGQESLRPASQ